MYLKWESNSEQMYLESNRALCIWWMAKLRRACCWLRARCRLAFFQVETCPTACLQCSTPYLTAGGPVPTSQLYPRLHALPCNWNVPNLSCLLDKLHSTSISLLLLPPRPPYTWYIPLCSLFSYHVAVIRFEFYLPQWSVNNLSTGPISQAWPYNRDSSNKNV